MEIKEVELYKPRKRKPTSAFRKKRLKKDRDSWTEYGLKKPQKPRYVGLQGILWFVVSSAVRQEEFIKYDGYCVDGCGGRVERWQDADCGHFQDAGKVNTRFCRENLGLQLKGCNMGRDFAYGFGNTINERYGKGTAEYLIELSRQPGKNMDNEELDKEIRRYLTVIESLK